MILAFCLLVAVEASIDHVVAIMFENRAFDHLLGHLKAKNPNINGLTGKESCPIDPSNPSLGSQRVSFDAPDCSELNPGHGVPNTAVEMFGQGNTISDPAPMNGFIIYLVKDKGVPLAQALDVMKCFNETSVPVLSKLALAYSVFDSWHASVPGPTMVNRAYAFAATSNGWAEQSVAEDIMGFTQHSIFGDFDDVNVDYKVYFSDVPSPVLLDDLRKAPWHMRPMVEFELDAALGDLPKFSWLDPRYFSIGEFEESDQHPGEPIFGGYLKTDSVMNGDRLVRWVYEVLRSSPKWNNTMLLVYYDEHGGMYDHVSPRLKGVPNPDGINSTQPPFAFDRLGVRVPAVLISPRVKLGSVLRPPAGKSFEHSSLLGTMRALFPELPRKPLTKREAWAATFEDLFDQPPCGNQCPPLTLTSGNAREEAAYKKFVSALRSDDGTLDVMQRAISRGDTNAHYAPLNDLQDDLLNMCHSRTMPDDVSDVEREARRRELVEARKSSASAALYIRRRLTEFQQRQNKN